MNIQLPTPKGATRPKRPCKVNGCSALVSGKHPYCKEHTNHNPSLRQANSKKTDPFYLSTRWRKTSKLYRKHNPVCECKECEQLGRVLPAECVDHIIPIKEGGAKFDWDNLQSMSWSCHTRKTRTETTTPRP